MIASGVMLVVIMVFQAVFILNARNAKKLKSTDKLCMALQNLLFTKNIFKCVDIYSINSISPGIFFLSSFSGKYYLMISEELIESLTAQEIVSALETTLRVNFFGTRVKLVTSVSFIFYYLERVLKWLTKKHPLAGILGIFFASPLLMLFDRISILNQNSLSAMEDNGRFDKVKFAIDRADYRENYYYLKNISLFKTPRTSLFNN